MNNQQSILNNSTNYVHRILKTDIKKDPNSEEDEIIFGCGCFWGAEKCFWKLPGVVTTSVGYAGGNKTNPSYYEVCTGLTGHTEVVRVIWNTNEIDISDLLKMFWECHDPTQKNRQGNDMGTQYRSAIYYKNENNKKTILMISHQLSVAATCDRVLVMNEGVIVQEGKHKDLVIENGLYKQLWERELATNKIRD